MSWECVCVCVCMYCMLARLFFIVSLTDRYQHIASRSWLKASRSHLAPQSCKLLGSILRLLVSVSRVMLQQPTVALESDWSPAGRGLAQDLRLHLLHLLLQLLPQLYMRLPDPEASTAGTHRKV